MSIEKVLRWVCMTIMLAAAVSCVRVTPHPGPMSSQETYIVQPPDVLQVALTPEEYLTRNCIVRPDGCITFDMIGDIHVAGLTPAEIDDLITERLSEYIKNVEVAVSVEGTPSKQYFVLGEVGRPGPYPLNGEISASAAVAIAGGVTQHASYRNVYVLRGGAESPQAFRIAMRGPLLAGDTSEDMMLKPGDIVNVRPSVMGKVGYFVQNLLFPIQPLLGGINQISYTIATGGTGRYSGGRAGSYR